MFAVQSASFVAVVDGQDKAALQGAPRAFDPITRFKSHFRLLSFFKRNSLLVKISLQGRHGGLANHLGELRALESYLDFPQRTTLHDNAVRGQSVQQFI